MDLGGGAAAGWVSLATLAAFFLVETPGAPNRCCAWLWRSRTFRVTSAVGFIIGFALFGAVTFLPLFQQVVRGQSPTASGLQLLPLMGGLMVSSVVSGRLIARTGRYRRYPIAGTAIATGGLFLLSLMGSGTSDLLAGLYMVVLGLGLGMVMQVLILAVQNDAAYEDLGAATAGATLFRSIGGSLGTAVLGAVFTNRLTAELADRLPHTAGGLAGSGEVNPGAVGRLPQAVRVAYIDSFTHALGVVFTVSAAVALLAFALTWLIGEVPLRTTLRDPAPSAPEPTAEVEEPQAAR
ncbi:MAG: MFS transporter [Thermoleophilia bacterium]